MIEFWRVSPGNKAILFRDTDNDTHYWAEVHNGDVKYNDDATAQYVLKLTEGEYKCVI